MKPKDRIKARIWYDAHMASTTHKGMYGIMHIFQTVVQVAPPISVPCVGERRVIRLIGDELAC